MAEEKIINQDLPEGVYRLISLDGTTLGIMPKARVLQIANEKKLDAVLMNGTIKPGIVKLFDYEKAVYDNKKFKKQKTERIKLKQMEFDNPMIQENDLKVKIGKIREWLEKGDNVQIAFRIKGRMNDARHIPMIEQIMEKIELSVNDIGYVKSKEKNGKTKGKYKKDNSSNFVLKLSKRL